MGLFSFGKRAEEKRRREENALSLYRQEQELVQRLVHLSDPQQFFQVSDELQETSSQLLEVVDDLVVPESKGPHSLLVRSIQMVHDELPEQIQNSARDMIVRSFRSIFALLERLADSLEFTEENFVGLAQTELFKLNLGMEACKDRFSDENWQYYSRLYKDYLFMVDREAARVPKTE